VPVTAGDGTTHAEPRRADRLPGSATPSLVRAHRAVRCFRSVTGVGRPNCEHRGRESGKTTRKSDPAARPHAHVCSCVAVRRGARAAHGMEARRPLHASASVRHAPPVKPASAPSAACQGGRYSYCGARVSICSWSRCWVRWGCGCRHGWVRLGGRR